MDRIYSAEQIEVPPAFPRILKDYSKEVIRFNPADIAAFSRECVSLEIESPITHFPTCIPTAISQHLPMAVFHNSSNDRLCKRSSPPLNHKQRSPLQPLLHQPLNLNDSHNHLNTLPLRTPLSVSSSKHSLFLSMLAST